MVSKAVALYSGGLDSVLAIKLIIEQGIDVTALNFTSPFFRKDKQKLLKYFKKDEIIFEQIDLGQKFLKLLKKPRHGFGKNMNPCIDCKILMLKEAKKYAKKVKADFIFTGEVLGERPFSQNKNALEIIEQESELKGKLLRPLSAKLLRETVAEKKGIVDRRKLMDISGRGRHPQFSLAKKYSLTNYETPSGGCLLTEPSFSRKVRDLYSVKKNPNIKDAELLKFGRHFRFEKNKIMVGRNEKDNKKLLNLREESDYFFEVKDVGSPITLLQGKKTKQAIKLAAQLTARYSDSKEDTVKVHYGKTKLNKTILAKKLTKIEIEKIRV